MRGPPITTGRRFPPRRHVLWVILLWQLGDGWGQDGHLPGISTTSRPVEAWQPPPQPRRGGAAPTAELERTVVILYHKPAQVVTTHAVEEGGRRNVYQELATLAGYVAPSSVSSAGKSSAASPRPAPPRWLAQSLVNQVINGHGGRPLWHAVGRLDADTTGLLLLTNDGGLVHHVTNHQAASHQPPPGVQARAPNHHHHHHHHHYFDSQQSDRPGLRPASALGKTYNALIMGHHDDDTSSLLATLRQEGVDLGVKYGGRTDPVPDLQVLQHPTPTTTLVSLTLYQGRNRQVRRMFHALGSGVMQLTRTRLGPLLTLEGLDPGQWRILSDREVEQGLGWTPRLLQETWTPNHRRSTTLASQGTPTHPHHHKRNRRRRT